MIVQTKGRGLMIQVLQETELEWIHRILSKATSQMYVHMRCLVKPSCTSKARCASFAKRILCFKVHVHLSFHFGAFVSRKLCL